MAKYKAPANDPGNVGAFVQQSYGGNKRLADRIYAQLRSQGARFYLDPSSSKFSRVTGKLESASPDGWGNSNVVGGWWEKPNLDTSQFEIGQNKVGKYFARKPTIEQQLKPWENSALSYFDTSATNAMQPVTAAYDQYQQSAQKRADDMKANNTSLQSLMQKVGESDTGATAAGVARSNASENSANNAALSAAKGANATENYYATLPTVAANQRANALAQMRGTTLTERQKLVASLMKNKSDRETAISQAEQATAKARLQLRGQQLAFMGQLYGAQAGIDAANINANARMAGDQLDASTAAAIAAANNANDIDVANIAANATAAGNQQKGFNKWQSELRSRMRKKTVANPAYDPNDPSKGTQLIEVAGSNTGWAQLIAEGIQQGYGPGAVVSAVATANPSLKRGGNSLNSTMFRTLVNAGVDRGTARVLANRFVPSGKMGP